MSFPSFLIRRWWFWLVVLLVVAGVTLVTIHATGRAALRKAQARDGLPALIASRPWLTTLDAAHQEALAVWCRSTTVPPRAGSHLRYGSPLAQALGIAPRPGAELPLAERMRYQLLQGVDLIRLAALLDGGPLACGMAGRLRAGMNGADLPAAMREADLAISSLYAGAQGWSDYAVMDVDPLAGRHLDQLLAVTQQVACLQDLILHNQMSAVRDAVRFRLLADGRLGATAARAWCEEPSTTMTLAGDAIRGELAMLLANPQIADDDLGQWLAQLQAGLGELAKRQRSDNLRDTVWCYLMIGHKAAELARQERELVTLLDHGPIPEGFSAWYKGAVAQPGHANGWSAEHQRHRAIRAAAQLLLAWRADALPPDQAAAGTVIAPALLHGDRFLPPLLYERLSPTRFRLGVDPLGPLPAFTTRAVLRANTAIGQPAAILPLVEQAWSLELDCAALPPRVSSR